MSPTLAALICFVGIAGLFFLDRDSSIRTSKALWLPIIWIAIVGSRPVSVWFGLSSPAFDSNQLVESNAINGLIFQILLALGIIVLIGRHNRITAFLKGSWPILLYLLFCLLSVAWSDYPDISFKRWIKSLGDLVMVLIVVSDLEPMQAFKRLISRVGFILMPASVLLIKYFGDLGRGYDPDGNPMNTGVTTNKNTLGVITLAITLGALWQVLALLRDKERPDRWRHLLAQITLLIFGTSVLWLAHSATSQACFGIGAALMLATRIPVIGRHPARVHALILVFVIVTTFVLVFAPASVAHALGRQTDLTGRLDIWKSVIPAVPNRIVGAGFESFWLGPRLDVVWGHLSAYLHVNEAHNGYIEVYLNLGWIGLGLIALILLNGYRRIVGVFREDEAMGCLWLAYFFAAVFYSITEAGFRLLDPIWIFLLLAIVAASGATRHVRSAQLVGAAKSNARWRTPFPRQAVASPSTSRSEAFVPSRRP